jgi:hypothetical protein
VVYGRSCKGSSGGVDGNIAILATIGSVTERANTMHEDNAAFSQIGGARINLMNVTYPYAELSIFRNALRLTCLDREYVFLRGNIIALAKYRGLFSTGLNIRHSVPTYPEFIVFWVNIFGWGSRYATLKKQLQAFGYEVNE